MLRVYIYEFSHIFNIKQPHKKQLSTQSIDWKFSLLSRSLYVLFDILSCIVTDCFRVYFIVFLVIILYCSLLFEDDRRTSRCQTDAEDGLLRLLFTSNWFSSSWSLVACKYLAAMLAKRRHTKSFSVQFASCGEPSLLAYFPYFETRNSGNN